MARRKIPSKRRTKARLLAGRPVPLIAVARHDLHLWISDQPHTVDDLSWTVSLGFRVPGRHRRSRPRLLFSQKTAGG